MVAKIIDLEEQIEEMKTFNAKKEQKSAPQNDGANIEKGSEEQVVINIEWLLVFIATM